MTAEGAVVPRVTVDTIVGRVVGVAVEGKDWDEQLANKTSTKRR